MKLINLLDCIDFRQDIEIYICDTDTGYLSKREYYGTKRDLLKSGFLQLEVNSIEICHYNDRDSALRVILFTNQW